MPTVEVLVYILTGTVTLISLLGGALWKMLRSESKMQTEAINQKADTDRVHEMEQRWQTELSGVRSDNERLIDKLSQRHDREIDQLSTRLGEQIRTTETNILTQIRLMVQVLQSKD